MIANGSLVYPLDTVKTRLQALPDVDTLPRSQAPKPRSSRNPLVLLRRWNMLNMLVKIVRTEGVSGTFKGFAASMINTFSMRESAVSNGASDSLVCFLAPGFPDPFMVFSGFRPWTYTFFSPCSPL